MNAFDSCARLSLSRRIAIVVAIAAALALPIGRAHAQDTPPADDAPSADAPVAEDAPVADAEDAPVTDAEDAPVTEDATETVPVTPAAEAEGEADAATAPTLGDPSQDGAAEPAVPAPTTGDEIAEDIAAESVAAEAPAEEEAAPPASEPSPFRGSLFSWQQGMTVHTLDPSAQLTYDPTYYWSFFVQPRYYLDRQNFLVLSQGLSVELTDAGYTTTQREPQLSDTVLEWRHIEVVEGFVFIPSVRLAAPLSTWSQAADRVLNTGVGLTVVKVFPEAASFTIALTGAYRHWFALTNVVTAAQPYGCRLGGDAAAGGCDQAGGLTTERDRLLGALTLTVMPLPGFTVLTQYAIAAAYGHELRTETIGSTVTYADDGNHWRNFQYWTLAVGYDVVPWLNLQLGYQSASFMTGLYNDDGSVRNPFYNPESELFLTATIALDVLTDEIVGTGDEVSPEQLQRRRQGLASRAVDGSF